MLHTICKYIVIVDFLTIVHSILSFSLPFFIVVITYLYTFIMQCPCILSISNDIFPQTAFTGN